ncbi:MAG: metallophosphoesterase family protein [Alphaproteobacteria bacterium]
MKLGIVSDLHCNIEGLNKALEIMGQVDELLCLGDSIYEYRFSNEVVATLRDRNAQVIQGNHEEVFLGIGGARARARDTVDRELLGWLADQPARRTLEFGGKTVLMVHSTPWEPRGEYVYPHSPNINRFGETDADFVLYGHTHQQIARRIGASLVINPGSAGDGRDQSNGRALSCAVLDTVSEEVVITDFEDPQRARNVEALK